MSYFKRIEKQSGYGYVYSEDEKDWEAGTGIHSDPKPVDTGEAEVEDGVKFAELYGELRRTRDSRDHYMERYSELLELNRIQGESLDACAAREVAGIQALKTMTEDRDHWLRMRQPESPVLPGGWWEDQTGTEPKAELPSAYYAIPGMEKLNGATTDERAIAVAFVDKLMGEGRREHGALDLAHEERDLLGESKDELDDSISYLLMVRRRLEVMTDSGSIKQLYAQLHLLACSLEEGTDGKAAGRRIRHLIEVGS